MKLTSSGRGKHPAPKKKMPAKRQTEEAQFAEFDGYDGPIEDDIAPMSEEPAPKAPQNIDKKAQKRSKKKKGLRTTLLVLLILAVLVAAAFIAIEVLTEPPQIDESGIKIFDTGDEDPTNDKNDDVKPGVTNGRNNGMYTLLVVGRDKVGNNTDTIMVGRIDVVNKTINVVNIPRDTLVNIGYNKKNINYVYPACVNNGKDAIAALADAVSDMLGFNVDNYIVIDLQAAEEMVDCIGGVEFDVPIDMQYEDFVQDLYIDIHAGLQTLSGADAVKVFRYRASYPGGDIQRIGVQQDLLKAIAKQVLSIGNVPNLGTMLDIVEQHTETDLTPDNIRFYIKAFLTMDMEDITFHTLPYCGDGMIFTWSSLFADIDAWIDMVNEYLNPYVDRVTINNVNMLTFKDGNFYYTTEEMRGSISGMLGYQAGTSVANAGVYKYVSNNSNEG